MTDVQTRAYPAVLELREQGDGRTLVGVAVPYGVEARIGPRLVEVFVRGAFAGTDPAVVPLDATHPRTAETLPIGVAVELDERADGLHGAWHVSHTPLGDDVLALARDGVPLGLSVGFAPLPGSDRWSPDRRRVERRAARLDHVAIVRRGAYPGAMVAAVRGAVPETGTPLLALARRWR